MNSNLLLDDYPLVVLPRLAVAIGLNEAIVLQQIHYWLVKNKEAHRNYRDGSYWVYNSLARWQKQFPWWSESTVKRIFSSLEKQRLLISGNYNKLKLDRTKWYRIDYGVLNAMCQNEPMEEVSLTSPIPETKIPDIKLKDIVKVQSAGLHQQLFGFVEDDKGVTGRKENIFRSTTEKYGHDRVSYMLSVVDWYIDEAYPAVTNCKHPEESKAKRMVFVDKLLECSSSTVDDDEIVAKALERAINNFSECDPTIYYVTTPKVLGYWLIQDEELDYTCVNDTDYAPVENMY